MRDELNNEGLCYHVHISVKENCLVLDGRLVGREMRQ